MKVTKVEKITDEKWVNLYAATYENRGKKGRWVYASRREQDTSPDDHIDAVIIVPVLREKGKRPRLVMQKEYRVPLADYNYAFPAGLVDEGETVEGTVRREVREESGLDLVKIKKISPHLSSTAGLSDETVVLAFVDVKPSQDGEQQLESSEDIEVMLLTFKQACALCDSPDRLVDAKAWSVLFMYQQLGKFE